MAPRSIHVSTLSLLGLSWSGAPGRIAILLLFLDRRTVRLEGTKQGVQGRNASQDVAGIFCGDVRLPDFKGRRHEKQKTGEIGPTDFTVHFCKEFHCCTPFCMMVIFYHKAG